MVLWRSRRRYRFAASATKEGFWSDWLCCPRARLVFKSFWAFVAVLLPRSHAERGNECLLEVCRFPPRRPHITEK